MSIRAFIDDEPVFKKPRGNAHVQIETFWHGGYSEDIVSLAFREGAHEKSVWIGGVDVERMLRKIAADPRYAQLFDPRFAEHCKLSERTRESEP
jgi:hypothetical protein